MESNGTEGPAREEGSFSRELSAEQLQEVLRLASTSVEEASTCLGRILTLQDHRIIPRDAFVLDYCLGIIMFSQEAGFNSDQTLALYSLGLDLLDIVKRDGSFDEAQAAFEQKMMALSCKDCGAENPAFQSVFDVQKATEYFTSTLFQHYCLYCYCFTKLHCHVTRSETVHVETALVVPLREAMNEEEYQADQAAKAAAKAAAEAEEQARLEAAARAEAEAVAAAEAARVEEERKRKPQSLEEAVEFVVREKMAVVKQSLDEEYSQHEQALLDKLKDLAPPAAAAPAPAPAKKR